MLLEKACAKLHGSYEALAGKRTDHLLSLFTGGFIHKILVNEPIVKKNAVDWGLFELIDSMLTDNSGKFTNSGHQTQVWCSLNTASPGENANNRGKNHGLLPSIVYSISKIIPQKKLPSGEVRPLLLQLWNPADLGRYWGPYSTFDGQVRHKVSEGRDGYAMASADGHVSTRQESYFWILTLSLTLTLTLIGQESYFWIEGEAFLKLFDSMWFSIYKGTLVDKGWHQISIRSAFDGDESGGSLNKCTWWKNKQYRLTMGNRGALSGDRSHTMRIQMRQEGDFTLTGATHYPNPNPNSNPNPNPNPPSQEPLIIR